MKDIELFNAVVENFASKYHLTVEHPYEDEYIEIKQNGKTICEMNPKGRSLLYVLRELTDALVDELR